MFILLWFIRDSSSYPSANSFGGIANSGVPILPGDVTQPSRHDSIHEIESMEEQVVVVVCIRRFK